MSQSVTSSLYVKLVADAGDWESGMAAATSATQKFEAAAKKAARSPGLQSSIGSGEQAQIRKALELRQRYAGMGGDVAGPVRVTDKMVSDESERIILNRLVRSRNAEEQRAAAASAASNHIIMVQKSEAEAFALSERKKELAISLVNQAIANASELERQQAVVTANAIAQTEAKKQAAIALTEAKKQAAIEQTAAVNARISQAMALQRGQVLADMTATSGNRINASNSMFAQQAASATIETKKLWSAQTQAKVAANALAYSLGTTAAGGAAGATRNFGSTAADSTRKYARFGVIMQQAGYQVQDFAVQVAGGQNKLVAFSQQGAQLLGVFGVQGAIAGAALSVGILAYRMTGLTDETKKSEAALKTNLDVLKEFIAARRELDLLLNPTKKRDYLVSDVKQAGRDATDANQALADAESQNLEDQKQRRKRVLTSLFTGSPLTIGINSLIAMYQSSQSNQVISEKNRDLSAAQTGLTKTTGALTGYDIALRDVAKSEALLRAGRIAETMKGRTDLASRNDTIFESIKKQQKKIDALQSFDSGFDPALQDEMNTQLAEANLVLDEMLYKEADLAKKYRDQLDPLYQQKRVWEEISDLKDSGFLNPQEATDARAKILRDINLARKMPDSMQVSAGVLSSGLSTSSIAPNQLLDVSRQMLSTLRQLVTLETVGARGY